MRDYLLMWKQFFFSFLNQATITANFLKKSRCSISSENGLNSYLLRLLNKNFNRILFFFYFGMLHKSYFDQSKNLFKSFEKQTAKIYSLNFLISSLAKLSSILMYGKVLGRRVFSLSGINKFAFQLTLKPTNQLNCPNGFVQEECKKIFLEVIFNEQIL